MKIVFVDYGLHVIYPFFYADYNNTINRIVFLKTLNCMNYNWFVSHD